MKRLTFLRWSRGGAPVTKRLKAGALMAGLAWALGAMLAACTLMCAWVVLTAGPVYNLSTFVAAGSILGAILGGIASGRAAGTLGLLHGFLTGTLYGLFLMALMLSLGGEGFSADGLALRTALMGGAGSLGGICGVNLQYRERYRPGRKVCKQRIF